MKTLNAEGPGRLRQVLGGSFRWVTVLHTFLLCLQPFLAGSSLDGSETALDWHGINASVILTVGLVQSLVGIVLWRPGGGPGWPALVAIGLFAMAFIQLEVGYGANLSVHLPLGVSIVVVSLWLLLRVHRRGGLGMDGSMNGAGLP